MLFKAPKYQMIEIPITVAPTGQLQAFNFQQQPQLQSLSTDKRVYIKGIEAYSSDLMPRSPITPGNNVLSPADIANAVLLINVAGTIEFNQVPLARLVNVQNTTTPNAIWPFLFRNLWEVDWTKSQVQFINPTTTVAPFSVLFGVFYDYTPDLEDLATNYVSIH